MAELDLAVRKVEERTARGFQMFALTKLLRGLGASIRLHEVDAFGEQRFGRERARILSVRDSGVAQRDAQQRGAKPSADAWTHDHRESTQGGDGGAAPGACVLAVGAAGAAGRIGRGRVTA